MVCTLDRKRCRIEWALNMQALGGIVKSEHRAYAPTVQSENGRYQVKIQQLARHLSESRDGHHRF